MALAIKTVRDELQAVTEEAKEIIKRSHLCTYLPP